MRTKEEFAKECADKIRGSKVKVAVKAAINKSISKSASKDIAEFEKTLNRTFSEIDGLIYTATNQPVDEDFIESLCRIIDNELSVPLGTVYHIKKSSVEMGINYLTSVTNLYDSIVYV